MTATRGRGARQAAGTDVLPPEEAQAIAALDEARRQIDIARANEDIDTLLDWADRAAAVAHYYKKREEARELADNAGELKVRAEAALGKLDLAARPGAGRPKPVEEGEEPLPPAPLADFESSRRSMFRTLGKLDTNQLDSVVDRLRADDDGGVTTSRAVRAARELLPIEHREGAAGGKPSKEARKELVTDYVQHVRALDTETSTLIRLARKVIPAATDGERQRIANRLAGTIVRLGELQETMAVDGAEPLVGADTEEE